MGEVTTTTWTCSRCGGQLNVPGTDQPRKWVRVYIANPPRHADHTTLGDLCNRCERFLYAYVTGKYEDEVARERELLAALERVEGSLANAEAKP